MGAGKPGIVECVGNDETWEGGTLTITINDVAVDQLFDTDKATSMDAMATAIEAEAGLSDYVESASYDEVSDTLTITPAVGHALDVVVDVSAVSGDFDMEPETTPEYPHWGEPGVAALVAPTEGKKDEGWTFEEKPPCEWQNWFQRTVENWIRWAENQVNILTEGLSNLSGTVAALATGNIANDTLNWDSGTYPTSKEVLDNVAQRLVNTELSRILISSGAVTLDQECWGIDKNVDVGFLIYQEKSGGTYVSKRVTIFFPEFSDQGNPAWGHSNPNEIFGSPYVTPTDYLPVTNHEGYAFCEIIKGSSVFAGLCRVYNDGGNTIFRWYKQDVSGADITKNSAPWTSGDSEVKGFKSFSITYAIG